ncbi:MAG: heparinase II/III family protein [Bacteroidales bacterium]|nr:heparinase II/III family protein [Bacteroidales bacterium]
MNKLQKTASVALAALLVLVFSLSVSAQERVGFAPLDPERVAQIEAMMPDAPFFFAPDYKDRAAWSKAITPTALKVYIKRADSYVARGGESTLEPWNPDWMDKWFNVPKTNDSQTGKDMNARRVHLLEVLALTECATGKGKYVKPVNDALRKIVRQPIWTHPRNYDPKQKVQAIELAAQAYATAVGTTLYLMDDLIEPDLRREAIDTLYSKVFNPLLASLEPGAKRRHNWLVGTNNWNTACLSGVLTAALAAAPDKHLRAQVASIAERYSINYTAGYNEDGYCTEGMSYYNYGFDKYLIVREELFRVTGGQIDIFRASPKVPAMMLFPFGMQMYSDLPPLKNSYASIADCGSNKRPSAGILFYNLKYLGIDEPSFANYNTHTRLTSTYDLLMAFTDWDSFPSVGAEFKPDPLRSYFSDSGILTCRPAAESPARLAVTMKGGHNAEHHNHNDVGAYNICLDGIFMMEDPGIAPYTGVTFSNKRYTINTINSYGHPVPTVDGAQQKEGVRAPAPVLANEFSAKEDRFAIEMKDFYTPAVADLQSIKRSFLYERSDKPAFTVRDEFSAGAAHVYESAITTRSEVSVKKNVITFTRDGLKLKATVTSDGPVVISTEQLGGTPNEAKVPFTRISVKAKGARKDAWIQIRYSL